MKVKTFKAEHQHLHLFHLKSSVLEYKAKTKDWLLFEYFVTAHCNIMYVGCIGYKRFTLLRMISGARYSGVPHNVQVLPFTLLAKPKSVT